MLDELYNKLFAITESIKPINEQEDEEDDDDLEKEEEEFEEEKEDEIGEEDENPDTEPEEEMTVDDEESAEEDFEAAEGSEGIDEPELGGEASNAEETGTEPEAESEEESKEAQIEKQYLGKKDDDTYYYLNKIEGGWNVSDAEGRIVFPIKGEAPEVAENDVLSFVIAAQKNLELTEISGDIFSRYVQPAVDKEQEKRDEEAGIEYEGEGEEEGGEEEIDLKDEAPLADEFGMEEEKPMTIESKVNEGLESHIKEVLDDAGIPRDAYIYRPGQFGKGELSITKKYKNKKDDILQALKASKQFRPYWSSSLHAILFKPVGKHGKGATEFLKKAGFEDGVIERKTNEHWRDAEEEDISVVSHAELKQKLRQQEAEKMFGKDWEELDTDEQKAVDDTIWIRKPRKRTFTRADVYTESKSFSSPSSGTGSDSSGPALNETVSELIYEVPGIDEVDQMVLEWAIGEGIVPNKFPDPFTMLMELDKVVDVTDDEQEVEEVDALIDAMHEGGNYSESVMLLQIYYLKKILLPKAHDAYTGKKRVKESFEEDYEDSSIESKTPSFVFPKDGKYIFRIFFEYEDDEDLTGCVSLYVANPGNQWDRRWDWHVERYGTVNDIVDYLISKQAASKAHGRIRYVNLDMAGYNPVHFKKLQALLDKADIEEGDVVDSSEEISMEDWERWASFIQDYKKYGRPSQRFAKRVNKKLSDISKDKELEESKSLHCKNCDHIISKRAYDKYGGLCGGCYSEKGEEDKPMKCKKCGREIKNERGKDGYCDSCGKDEGMDESKARYDKKKGWSKIPTAKQAFPGAVDIEKELKKGKTGKDIKKMIGEKESKMNEVKFVFDRHNFNVELTEDNENGITINVNDKQKFNFTPHFANLYRDEKGQIGEDSLVELAKSALSNLSEEYFEELARGAVEQGVEDEENIKGPEEPEPNIEDEPVEESKNMKKKNESIIPDDSDSEEKKIEKLTEGDGKEDFKKTAKPGQRLGLLVQDIRDATGDDDFDAYKLKELIASIVATDNMQYFITLLQQQKEEEEESNRAAYEDEAMAESKTDKQDAVFDMMSKHFSK